MPPQSLPSALPDVLQQLFPELKPHEADRLACCCAVHSFARGERLCEEGSSPQQVMVLLQGELKLVRSTPQGKEHILLLVHPGRIVDAGLPFGRGGVIGSAVALSAGKVLGMDREVLREVLAENGRLALAFLDFLAVRQRMLAHKVAGSQGHISVRRRVAGWLVHRARVEGASTVQANVSREVMAGQLGIARESLSRQLSLLAREGLIRLEPGRILLLDEERLRDVANE